MSDDTELDLGDLDTRAEDLDNQAAEDVSGGWFKRGRGGNRNFSFHRKGFNARGSKPGKSGGPVSRFTPIKNKSSKPKRTTGGGSSGKSMVFRGSFGARRPSMNNMRTR